MFWVNFLLIFTFLSNFVRTKMYAGAVRRACTYEIQISLAKRFSLREREREREEILYVQPRRTCPAYKNVRTFWGDFGC